jgi:hypothetical protein
MERRQRALRFSGGEQLPFLRIEYWVKLLRGFRQSRTFAQCNVVAASGASLTMPRRRTTRIITAAGIITPDRGRRGPHASMVPVAQNRGIGQILGSTMAPTPTPGNCSYRRQPHQGDRKAGMLSDMRQYTLRVATRHVATGRRIVARQCAIIARLEEDGCSTVAAVLTCLNEHLRFLKIITQAF